MPRKTGLTNVLAAMLCLACSFASVAPRLIDREGRERILQPAQVAGEFDAEDVGAGGQDLAQFDGHGPQMFKGLAQPLARTAVATLPAGEGVQQMGQPADPDRQQMGDLARDQGVVADQHPAPAHEAQPGLDRMAHRHGRRRGRRGRGIDPAGQIAHP